MSHAIVLKHMPYEGPARLADLLAARGYTLDVRELQRGHAVPERLAREELLIVMGGPMGVADLDHPEFPFLRRELELLQRCIAEQAPVLGICLGAQLLAAAAGARVEPMRGREGERVYEVGWSQVRFHHQGAHDPVLAGVPVQAAMLHWHGDRFELPRAARLLASTEICNAQAFQLGGRQFGLQFHCEVDAQHVLEFLRIDRAYVERANGPAGDARIRADTERHSAELHVVGDRLLGNLLDAMSGEASDPDRQGD